MKIGGLESLDFTRKGFHQELKHKELSKSFVVMSFIHQSFDVGIICKYRYLIVSVIKQVDIPRRRVSLV